MNSGITPAHASPQLVQFLDREMQPMLDEPNDIWAVGTVLFQLLISAYPPWDREVGPFMFGPTDKDMVESLKISDRQERATFTRGKIQAGQELWVSLSMMPSCQLFIPYMQILHVAAPAWLYVCNHAACVFMT